MIDTIKKISPATFGLVLICFFLPFAHISCQGQKVATITGIQLVTGTTIGGPPAGFSQEESPFGAPGIRPIGPETPRRSLGESRDSQKVDPEPLAILALCSAVAGLGLSFLKTKNGTIVTIVASALGLVFLLLLKAKIDNEVLKEGEGILRVEYGSGFWLAFVLFLCAIGLNVFLLSQMKKMESVAAPL